jgi:outer membrane lipoprotein-sorting protein
MKSFTMLAAAALALAVPAHADPKQNPTADYSADALSKTAGQPDSTSKIWYTTEKIRVDVTHQGQSMSVIMDRPAKKMTVLIQKSKLYQTEALPEGEANNPIAGGEWQVAKAGDEKVAGFDTTKWSVSGKGSDGRAFKGFIWTTKENIQVRMDGEAEEEGKTVKVSSELRNLKIGPVDAKVFEIPKDYKPVPKD